MRVLICILLLTASAGSQEWTRFRGPNGTGISEAKTIPVRWDQKQVNWNVQLPGVGHSSPVIWGDRLFIQSADPTDATQHILCYNAMTGKQIWQRDFPLDAYHIHTRSSFASVTPTVDASRVYVAWSSTKETTICALNHQGETIWQKDLGSYTSSHGFGTSPVIYKNLVILGHSQKKPQRNGPAVETSSVVALDRETGDIRWRTKRMSEKASYATPAILSRAGHPDELISCSTAEGIYSLDPETGKQNWAKRVFSMRTVSSPVIAGDLIFGSTGSGGGGNYVVALKPGPTPEVAYEVRRQAPYVPCTLCYQDMAFLWSDKGIVTCIDLTSGKKHWQQRIGGSFSGSPIVANGNIYCVSDDGRVVVLAAKKEYQLLGRNELGEASRSTPAVANGQIYFRTYSRLIAVGNVKST